ncbi:hypothetical protein F183_A51820 [Bryobacterales bacterium F-183]|nr:hypothetical protein F183_A51820 [Bryobacterales bacterium F-183]
MTSNQILLDLGELLESEQPLDGSEELASLENWDSMAVIAFIAFADDKCGKSLVAKDINACKTVGDLVNLVSKDA